MSVKTIIKTVVRLSCVCVFLSACNKPSPDTLVVGTISGPETALMDVAQQVAQKTHGLHLKIIEFNDYLLPNIALQDGTLDANVYQHEPYLTAATQAHDYHFKVIGKTFVYPTGLYSTKYNKMTELPEHAVIALPNDPSNEGRALVLLQDAGLITLNDNKTNTLHDIATNPKKIHFEELDAAQLPRILMDVDAAVINTNFAIPAGLQLSEDALFVENKNSPYANLIVTRQDASKQTQLNWLVEALHSAEVKAKAQELFGEAAIPAW